jgi:hypothetical protein
LQRFALSLGKSIHPRHEWQNKPMQGCVTEFAFGFDPSHASNAKITRRLCRVVEQPRLTHARVAPKHEYSAHAGSNGGEHVVECLALMDTPEQAHQSIHRKHWQAPIR